MKFLLCWSLLWLGIAVAEAQPTYVMSNQTVSDCRAFFEDSGANPVDAGNYANNENFVFHIINPQATQINFSFSAFCLEVGSDTLFFYDGPTVNSPLLGAFTGVNMPPGISSTGGALTIRFVSDLSITCTGWQAYWTTIVPPPVPPNLNQITAQCQTNTIDVLLDTLVHCDSVYAAAFVLTGGQGQQIIAAQALNCVQDSTNQIRLTVDAPFTDCATYGLDWQLNLLDVCDSLYTFLLNNNFSITDCPIQALLTTNDDSICVNECVLITAAGEGGDCNYSYQWLSGMPAASGPGPHWVCLDSTRVFTVVVDDGTPTAPDTVSLTILVSNPPFTGNDTLVCDQSAAFDLAPLASPPGGVFYGTGITAAAAGTFDPQLAGTGLHRIYYSWNGCADSLDITVVGVNAGQNLATCPNGPALVMTGQFPAGGTWSGPNVNAGGLYLPPAYTGVDTLYYQFANCQLMRLVYIDTITMPAEDTSCASAGPRQLSFSPPGGIWSGQGIVDANAGIFSAANTTPGDIQLIYTINGCSDTLWMHIRPIDAGPNLTVCPLSAPFNLPSGSPAGGWWIGPGISDSLAGTFNPAVNGTFNSQVTLFYHTTDCNDSLVVFLRRTNIVADTLSRCIDAPNFPLTQANTGRTPGGGVWSGPGVNPAGNGLFQSGVAGTGYHRLYYTVNGCVDSLLMYVSPRPQAPADTQWCISQGNLPLSGLPAGGTWSGPGVYGQLFIPDSVGVGTYTLHYQTGVACTDSMLVTVNPLPQPDISANDTAYCVVDSLFTLQLLPAGGVLSGPGVINNQFNPSVAGNGRHLLVYRVGAAACERSDSLWLSVANPLQLQAFSSADTLCYGDSLLLYLQKSGGLPQYQRGWRGLANTDSIALVVTQSGWYTAWVDDGCSTPASDSVFVYVHPAINYSVSQQQVNCFDSLGLITVTYPPGSPYRIQWFTLPNRFGDSLQIKQGSYSFRITDTLSGCYLLDTVVMQSYPILSANFSTNPNERCHELAQAELSFIDLSRGAAWGTWYFGDGDTAAYVFGQYPQHLYTDTGRYLARLVLYNAFGCMDTHEAWICVRVEPELFVPNAFSPNGDGINDFFTAAGVGIRDFEIRIYNRWGEAVFLANGLDFQWDGRFRDDWLPPGLYPFVISYTDYLGYSRKYYKGNIQLIR